MPLTIAFLGAGLMATPIGASVVAQFAVKSRR